VRDEPTRVRDKPAWVDEVSAPGGTRGTRPDTQGRPLDAPETRPVHEGTAWVQEASRECL
jgi:hypothetical protein